MSTKTPTDNGRATLTRVPERVESQEDTLPALAVEQIRRVRRFKLHLMTFAIGLPLIGVVWVLTEYFEEHTWPSRFASAPDVAGTWDPWFFWVAGIWLVVLAIHALKTYFGSPRGLVSRYVRRPPTEDEIDREMDRLRRLS